MTPAPPADPRAPRPAGANLILIGYRGAGKTSVGQRLAEVLGRPFVDSDAEIALHTGRTIAELFAQDGEPAFRATEAAIIAKLAARSGQVISIGGGAVLDPRNRDLLTASGLCFWLTAPPEELHRRLSADPAGPASRPALTGYDAAEEIRHVLAERAPLYAALADHVIETNGRPLDAIVEEIVARLAATPA